MCISACVFARARARGCDGGGGGGGRGAGGAGGVCVCGGMVGGMFLSVCVYVCVHGRYLEGLTVGGERERERVKFVSIVMWPVTKGLPVRDQC